MDPNLSVVRESCITLAKVGITCFLSFVFFFENEGVCLGEHIIGKRCCLLRIVTTLMVLLGSCIDCMKVLDDDM